MKWFLIFYTFSATANSMVMIPDGYSTKAECEAAGAGRNGISPRCIPGPDPTWRDTACDANPSIGNWKYDDQTGHRKCRP